MTALLWLTSGLLDSPAQYSKNSKYSNLKGVDALRAVVCGELYV